MSKVEFKEFVRKNPSLITSVENGDTTWQKLYELYDLYGEDSNVFDKYKNIKNTNNKEFSPFGNLRDLVNLIKGIDLNTVQKGLSSLDKAIEAFKDIIPSKKDNIENNYEPRPTYKYFED